MKFVFSGTLLRFTDYQRSLVVEAATVRTALAALVVKCPKLAPVLYDGAGQLRAVHRLFLNGTQLLSDELERPLTPSDELEVLTAIAGG
jgi:molybdopterin converting factor small subunit